MCCGGLNEKCPDRLMYWNTKSQLVVLCCVGEAKELSTGNVEE